MEPTFSIVIPTYNQSSLLKNAILSVVNQTYKNFEIIVIDNFSNDSTESVVKSFQTEKIKYFKKKNFGVIGKSRNEGINRSKGEWIAFLDSDDLWYSNRLDEIINFLRNNKSYEVLTSDEKIINKISNSEKIWKYGPYTENFYKKLLIDGNCLSTSATVVKRKFIIDNNLLFSEDKNLVTVEDYDFFLKLALKDARFKFLHKVLGEHLFHPNSESFNFKKHKSAYESLINYHVFLIQKFTKNKEKLRKKLDIHIRFMGIFRFLKVEKKILFGSFLFIKYFISDPINSILYILKKFK